MSTLIILIIYLCMTIGIVCLIPKKDHQGLRLYSLISSLFFFLMTIDLAANFNTLEGTYQFESTIPLMPSLGINFSVGVDGLSLCLLLLTAFIMPLCIFASKSIEKDYKQFILYLLIIELFLTVTFLSTNLFFFYMFFEGVLIPVFLLIGIWGSRERKINAAYYFFVYTIFGSFFLLYGILYLYKITGTLDIPALWNINLPYEHQIYLFMFFFIPFAIKVPMFPFHIWLPEAHVEAPTNGSVILASLLLKLGAYGFLRLTIPLFPAGCLYYGNFVFVLALVSIIYASLAALRQSDLKRVIAYSSIAHMNIVVLGIFSFTHVGMEGAIYLMIGHGLVSAALFFCVGVLYDRYHTRLIRHYSGLVQVMPLFCIFFFLFTCANMSFPGTANFVGEILIFAGLFIKNDFLVLFAALSIVLSAIYSIWIYNRIASGTLKIETENVSIYADINRDEYWILAFLLVGVFILGINSEIVTCFTNATVNTILEIATPKT